MNILRVILVMYLLFGIADSIEASLEPTGLAKPVADLRDYNGTYEGSVGTGSIGYSTLYRDNQDDGYASGCRGEGCGRHPGVDIPVPSGTHVYNAIAGQVVLSECNASWGGLVVVRATNPWNLGEQMYVTYAHLRVRRYSNGRLVLPGDYVTTGMRIGESGGNTVTDKCAGRSTGSHLHFQIDKNDGTPEPWYPHTNQLNYPDVDFQVTTKTYNPIAMVTGGYRWTFAQNGNRELWDLFNIQSWGVANNALWVDAGFDPYIRRGGLTNCNRPQSCSSNIAAEAQEYPQVFLNVYNHCAVGSGRVYFTTNLEQYWDEAKSVPYYTYFGSLNTHVIMANNWRWAGIITGLRIDPSEQCDPSAWDPTYYGEITIER